MSRHPIYYFVNLLIRVDTNRAEIYLASYSNGIIFFFHTLARSQTFFKVKGKRGEAVGVKFPAFYQQDEYDLLPSETGKNSHGLPTTTNNPAKGYSWERIIKLWKALGCRK